MRDKLQKHAQEIYKEAYNRAHAGREQSAHKLAWSAVKKKYRNEEASGKWLEAG